LRVARRTHHENAPVRQAPPRPPAAHRDSRVGVVAVVCGRSLLAFATPPMCTPLSRQRLYRRATPLPYAIHHPGGAAATHFHDHCWLLRVCASGLCLFGAILCPRNRVMLSYQSYPRHLLMRQMTLNWRQLLMWSPMLAQTVLPYRLPPGWRVAPSYRQSPARRACHPVLPGGVGGESSVAIQRTRASFQAGGTGNRRASWETSGTERRASLEAGGTAESWRGGDGALPRASRGCGGGPTS
jgi:hypothetical protein